MKTRNEVADALVAKLKTVEGVKVVVRRPVDFNHFQPDQMPAISIQQMPSAITPQKGLEGYTHAKKEMNFLLYVYTYEGTPEIPPSDQLNDICDAIETALQPDSYTAFQTLNDTVSHAWISGIIEPYESIDASGGLCAATIPINVLMNI